MRNLRPATRSRYVANVQFSGIFSGLEVKARMIPPVRERELAQKAAASGDPDAFAKYYAKECFVSGSGLTEAMFDALVELEAGSERPEVAEGGSIRLDGEMFEFLWMYAKHDDFRDRIMAVIRNLLKESEAVKNESGGER